MRSDVKTTVGSLFVCFLLEHHLRLHFTVSPLHLSTYQPFFTFTFWSFYHDDKLRGWLPVTPKNSINIAAYQGPAYQSGEGLNTDYLHCSPGWKSSASLTWPSVPVETCWDFLADILFPYEDYLSGSSAAVSASQSLCCACSAQWL